ncbi:MAG TPA: phage holin family protein [bacterium]|nr:phage holin family protein [bacterium]
MQAFLIRWLFNAVAVYVAARIVPGVRTPDFVGAIVAALILGVVNAIIRPIVLLLTLPVNILTLGLFTLVINTLMLYLVAWIAPSYLQLSGFGAAFLGALLITIISAVLSRVIAG